MCVYASSEGHILYSLLVNLEDISSCIASITLSATTLCGDYTMWIVCFGKANLYNKMFNNCQIMELK